MNSREKWNLFLKIRAHVGGIVYVPPTLYPRPACSSAHVTAYVERTERARTNASQRVHPVRHIVENRAFSGLNL
jgi:hypothetical protein